MTSDPLTLAAALAVGLFVGSVFFAGLYYTTSRVGRVARPALFMLASFVLRVALILGGAWLVAEIAAHWGLLAYLVGVTLARLGAVSIVGKVGRTEEA